LSGEAPFADQGVLARIGLGAREAFNTTPESTSKLMFPSATDKAQLSYLRQKLEWTSASTSGSKKSIKKKQHEELSCFWDSSLGKMGQRHSST